jgi:photosystem II stability/assembly factor-like uncharacterized protein
MTDNEHVDAEDNAAEAVTDEPAVYGEQGGGKAWAAIRHAARSMTSWFSHRSE